MSDFRQLSTKDIELSLGFESESELTSLIQKEKKQDLKKIEEDVSTIAEIMNDTSKLIHEQSPILNDLEYSLDETVDHTDRAVSSLNKAEKSSFWLPVIGLGSAFIIGLFLGTSHYTGRPFYQTDNHTQNPQSSDDKIEKD